MQMTDLENISTLDLLAELRRRFNCFNKPQKNVIFVGAPGSGKGTQSAILRSSHCYCHLATGDLLRKIYHENTDNAKKIQSQMAAGQLVDDDLVLGLIEEKINSNQCKRGFILDGFPRNIIQAEKLSKLLNKSGKNLDAVIYFDVDDEELVKRVEGRRVHVNSGRVYHTIYNPPKVENTDDITGEQLIQRTDDMPDVIRSRLNVFKKDTMPVADYYRRIGILHTLDARESTKNITERLYEIIDGSKVDSIDVNK